MDTNHYEISSSQEEVEETQVFLTKCFLNTNYNITLFPSHKHDQKLVSSLNLAYNLTFLVQIGLKKIQHMTQNGALLHQKQFNKLITSIVMVDNKNAIILLRSLNQQPQEIIGFNLQTYKTFSLLFFKELKGFCDMSIFGESKLICIKEKDQKMIKLTYYKYEIEAENGIKIEKNLLYQTHYNFKNNQEQLQKKLKITKLNNKSIIGIYNQEAQQRDQFCVFIYDPEIDHKNIKKYTFNGCLKKKQGLLFHLIDIWEYSSDILLVKYKSYPTDFQRGQKLFQTEEKLIKNMQKSYEFQWEYKSKSKKSVSMLKIIPNHIHYTHIRGQELNLVLQKDVKQYIHKSRQIRSQIYHKGGHRCGYSINQVALEKWIKNQPLEHQIPIYYINDLNNNQIAVEFQKFHIDQNKSKILVSVPYNPSFFIKYWQQNDNDKNILNINLKIMKQLKYPSKIIAAYFLTDIIEKCDEDLLYYVVNIIHQGQDQISFYHNY